MERPLPRQKMRWRVMAHPHMTNLGSIQTGSSLQNCVLVASLKTLCLHSKQEQLQHPCDGLGLHLC